RLQMRAALEETVFALAVADDWMGKASSIGHTSSPNLVGAPLGAMGVTGKAHRAQGRSYKSRGCVCRCVRRWKKQFLLWPWRMTGWARLLPSATQAALIS
ncbi:hypothetical protein QYZ34_20990, partial [Xanthomonas campestris pv. campestris]|uniref:hypothetical protein n=1 Tax=Xanthomonas campestris TaxID=339 RepID=UPI002AD44882